MRVCEQFDVAGSNNLSYCHLIVNIMQENWQRRRKGIMTAIQKGQCCVLTCRMLFQFLLLMYQTCSTNES